MKKLALILGGVIVALVAAIAILPLVIDLNDYKAEIAAQARAATGRDLVIDGDIDLAIFPAPAIAVNNIHLANVAGAAVPDMARIAAIRVRVAPWPLLRGEVRVESVTLVKPVIELERFADGGDNWTLTPAAPATTGGQGGGGTDIRLDKVRIEDGGVIFRDDGAGSVERIEAIAIDGSADSLAGPFRAEGKLSLRGLPVGFRLKLGGLERRPTPLALDLDAAGATLSFGGVLDLAGGTVGGKLKGAAATLTKLIAAASPGTDAGALLDQKASLSANITASAKSIAIDDIVFGLDGGQATGSVAVALEATPRIDLTLAFNRLDLDALLAGGGAKSGGERRPMAFTLPANIAANAELKINAVTYNDQIIRQVRVVVALDQGVATLQQASALLPGGSDVSIFGVLDTDAGTPRFTGNVQISSDNLRAALDWLRVPLPAVPADRLRTLSYSSAIELTPKLAKITDLDLRLDVSRLSGGINVALGARPAFNAILSLDAINLDAYLPPAGATGGGNGGSGDPFAALALTNGEIKANIGRLVYGGVPLSGIALDAGLRGGVLTLRGLTVENVAGIRANVSGLITAADQAADLTFAAATDDLGRGLRAFDVTAPTAVTELGAIALKGRVEGGPEALTIETSTTAAGVATTLRATLSNLAATPAIDAKLTATGDNLAQALRAFRVDPGLAGLATAFGVEATVKGGLDQARVGLDLDLLDGKARLAGTVAGLAATPNADLTLTIAHPRAEALLAALAPGAAAGVGPLGPLAVKAALKGDPAQANVTMAVDLAGGKAAVKGRLMGLDATPGYDLAVTVDHPDFAALVEKVSGSRPPAASGVLRLVASVKGDDKGAKIADLDLTAGKTTVGGGVDTRWDGPRPAIAATLKAGEIDLAAFAIGVKPASGGQQAATTTTQSSTSQTSATQPATATRWSHEPIDLSGLRAVDARLRLDAEALIADGRRFAPVNLDATLKDGVLTIDRLTTRAYDGALALTGNLDASATAPVATTKFTIKDADLGALLVDLAQRNELTGRLDLGGNLRAQGRSVAELVASLAGQTRFDVRDGLISGIDLGRLNSQLGGLDRGGDFLSLAGIALNGGTTVIRGLGGTITATDGVLRSSDIVADLDGGRGTATMTVDLPRWRIALDSQFQLTGHRDAPPIGISLSGPLDNPVRRTDTKALEKFAKKRLLKLGAKKLIPKLDKKTGGTLGGILDALTGGKTAQPAPQPAPVQPAPVQPQAQPQTTTPAPRPAPAQPQTKKPSFDSLIKGIIKGIGN